MDPTGNGADVEAPKDPGALKSHPSLSDNEILGEKRPKKVTILFDPFLRCIGHRNVYVGIHVPGKSSRSGHRHHHGSGHGRGPRHRHHRGRHVKGGEAGQDNRPGEQEAEPLLATTFYTSNVFPHCTKNIDI